MTLCLKQCFPMLWSSVGPNLVRSCCHRVPSELGRSTWIASMQHHMASIGGPPGTSVSRAQLRPNWAQLAAARAQVGPSPELWANFAASVRHAEPNVHFCCYFHHVIWLWCGLRALCCWLWVCLWPNFGKARCPTQDQVAHARAQLASKRAQVAPCWTSSWAQVGPKLEPTGPSSAQVTPKLGPSSAPVRPNFRPRTAKFDPSRCFWLGQVYHQT